MSIYSTEVQKLYVAYFGRPADPAGLAYFAAQAKDLTEVAGVFSHSQEANVLYNASTAAQIVEAIYQNLFGRGPEPAGLTFWTRQIESGSTTSGNAAIEILLSAKNDDALTVDNKLQAAQAFTDAIDTAEERAGYAGAAATDIARQFLSTITSSPSSLDNLAELVAKAVADATGTGRPTPPVDPSPWVPVFSASFTNGTFTFSNPGEELSFAVTGSNPLVYTFASTGTVLGTSAVIVTSAVSDIVVPAGKVLSITEDDFAGISAFSGEGTVKIVDPADTTITASLLQSYDDVVDGLLDATAYTKITGTVAELTAILVTNQGTSGNKIRTAADVAAQITGTTMATAAELKALEAATTGFVDATAITTLTGTIANAKLMLVTHKGTSGDKINTSGAIKVTLSDTGSVAAADIKDIDAATIGLVSATGITEITGSNTDIKAVLTASRHNTTTLDITSLTEIVFTTAIQPGISPRIPSVMIQPSRWQTCPETKSR